MATWFVATTGNDSNAGTSSGAAFLTVGHATSVAASGDLIAVKAGTYTITAVIVVATNVTIQGYQTTVGDGGTKPLITTATNSVNIFNLNPGVPKLDNLSLSNTAGTRGVGINLANFTSADLYVSNCILDGFTNGIDASGASVFNLNRMFIFGTEIKNCSGFGVLDNASGFGVFISGCWIHDTPTLVKEQNPKNLLVIDHSIFSGATTVAILTTAAWWGSLVNCSFYNNTLAISTSASGGDLVAVNNVFWANTTNAATPAIAGFFKKNASDGATSSFTADITLTANPFTSGTDFSLNATAGGGPLCKQTGFPGLLGSSQGYLDLGAIQSGAAAAPSGGGFPILSGSVVS